MESLQIIDQNLLNNVSSSAEESPRKRKNYNFHGADGDASHRLLNAMEPESYIPPHCHQDTSKDETIIVLRGKFGILFFDEEGNVSFKAVMSPAGNAVGVNIPHGIFHTLIALEPGSVFFESKAGPYQPLNQDEKAGWAPQEGEPEAQAFLEKYRALFA
ncbi:WbuC family cupin fold metalloprotein [Sulfurirhabdus autotrophica]|uniref:Cupin fold WbuC family metalloprotein n=1 Tax=Sulfurirhabdus autotrophica TaxID=1706046 RepID=A0A4R3Y6L6_9PROT|nr:WbuC family cupin fold metalloprotein [Sulfurirhabdus autotrophica]TCV87476.1 cupin fold WbuC family metalloprotein [Sulfurirhabdus autotrophica]